MKATFTTTNRTKTTETTTHNQTNHKRTQNNENDTISTKTMSYYHKPHKPAKNRLKISFGTFKLKTVIL